ncbi:MULTISPECIES: hypothetical protein [Haloferax]|uniref:DUF8006 domain-containing protein n=2 Tax=Haloferax gibbonsii TaxID=35746 RepID=A0A0K1IVQ3_HALGI|nr:MULTISPECIES: hypothetical protein [Haloferax]AKU08373.1 hypothetical protein ABY42_11755 [Haloferax gibbonsii]ELZ80772.1 hypothetical protein C454_10716 [Haloferax gibbonsii ATCC 33959]MCO8265602.1 hypothetical protein [Haloferax sp. AB510]QOS12479.1 uncharacterized protein HfgLR_11710 [Haloferax gibbonsii]RDZ52492.1 hypothetical protein C5C07_11985 [Haloferax sp. Atlit-4N]
MLPLQLVDTFLLDYNIGQALLLVFILSTVGTLPLKSRHVLGINTTVFGLIFLLTPVSLGKAHYLFLGIALLIVGPIVYVSGRR